MISDRSRGDIFTDSHGTGWLPYEGPTLVELVVEHRVHVLPETTTVFAHRSEHRGRERRRLDGLEIESHRWSQEIMDLVPDLVPRVPGRGIFVSSSELGSAGMFRTHELPLAIFCNDDVKALLQSGDFANLDFIECGDIV